MSIGATAAAAAGKAVSLAVKYGPAVIAGAKKLVVPMFKGIGKGIKASASWIKGKTGEILVGGKKIAENNSGSVKDLLSKGTSSIISGTKSVSESAKKGITEAMYWLNENNGKGMQSIVKAAGGVVMTGVAMIGINMLGMNLAHMVQKNCSSHHCDYSKTDLSSCQFDQCDNRSSSFTGAKMKNTVISRSSMSGTDLRSADLTNARIMGSNFRNTNMDQAVLRGAVFKDVDFSGSAGTVYTDDYTRFINCSGMDNLSRKYMHPASGIVLDRNTPAMQAVRNIHSQADAPAEPAHDFTINRENNQDYGHSL